MAKSFNLKLQVKMTGTVLAWEVFLEKITASSKVGAWIYNMELECYERSFENFTIDDNALDVYVGSEGKTGGKTTCKVIISGAEKKPAVTCNNIDKDYAHESFAV